MQNVQKPAENIAAQNVQKPEGSGNMQNVQNPAENVTAQNIQRSAESGNAGDKKEICTAIVLAAGQGKRMGNSVQKQYIEIDGKPVIYYTLLAFEESAVIDQVILVVGPNQEDYVRREIVDKYQFRKVAEIVEGGKERYDSVWQGLLAIQRREEQCPEQEKTDYVFIHDGARMFVDEDILRRGYETVREYRACVAGMPSKDTVKLVDENACAVQTPERAYVWTVQTPQVFECNLITNAYSLLMQSDEIKVTDDAMVVEQMLRIPVKMFEGSYRNVKLTTPEDLDVAESFLKKKLQKNKKMKKRC